MAEWFTFDPDDDASVERLIGDGAANDGAWPEAPVTRPEVLAMLFEVAREQVIAYAPADVPAIFDPVTLTWPDGSTVTLTRVGERVTAVVTPGNPDALPAGVQLMPTEFAPAGHAYQLALASTAAAGASRYLLAVLEDGAQATGQLMSTGDLPPFAAFTTEWLGTTVEEGTTVPSRYVYAQLQQAVNLWNAGRVSSSGDVGVDTFTFTPRPLDKTIKQIIRPVDGKPHVL